MVGGKYAPNQLTLHSTTKLLTKQRLNRAVETAAR